MAFFSEWVFPFGFGRNGGWQQLALSCQYWLKCQQTTAGASSSVMGELAAGDNWSPPLRAEMNGIKLEEREEKRREEKRRIEKRREEKERGEKTREEEGRQEKKREEKTREEKRRREKRRQTKQPLVSGTLRPTGQCA